MIQKAERGAPTHQHKTAAPYGSARSISYARPYKRGKVGKTLKRKAAADGNMSLTSAPLWGQTAPLLGLAHIPPPDFFRGFPGLTPFVPTTCQTCRRTEHWFYLADRCPFFLRGDFHSFFLFFFITVQLTKTQLWAVQSPDPALRNNEDFQSVHLHRGSCSLRHAALFVIQ